MIREDKELNGNVEEAFKFHEVFTGHKYDKQETYEFESEDDYLLWHQYYHEKGFKGNDKYLITL